MTTTNTNHAEKVFRVAVDATATFLTVANDRFGVKAEREYAQRRAQIWTVVMYAAEKMADDIDNGKMEDELNGLLLNLAVEHGQNAMFMQALAETVPAVRAACRY